MPIANTLTVALAGNPNCGKTVLFNALTGSRQRVGNWSGVTVDKKTGYFDLNDTRVSVVDLPGVYALNALQSEGALDQRIACDALLAGDLDVVINVVDATNLERNLYLTLQLLELQIPVIVAVNMMDRLPATGKQLDLDALSQSLRCPVIPIVATKQQGIAALQQVAIERHQGSAKGSPVPWPNSILQAIDRLAPLCQVDAADSSIAPRWLALHLLEGDDGLATCIHQETKDVLAQQVATVQAEEGEDLDIVIADARYGFIEGAMRRVSRRVSTVQQTVTDRIDKVVLHRFLGIPIFFAVMYLMFFFAVNVAGAFQDFFDQASTTVFVDGFAHLLQTWHTPNWLIAILANGIGLGINTTLTFVPVIGGMFLFLSLLEDSGYMARAAFVMDRLMASLGLPGKSFVPMIVGFGCNVPAVMGARTLASQRDRILTVLMMPFMSCGARLAIFAVFVSAFFIHGGGVVVFLLYVLGILAAILTGFMVRKIVLPGKPAPLVMELPPYHAPRLMVMLRQAWQRLKAFLTRASRVIIPVCVIVGGLNTITVDGHISSQAANSQSVLSAVGRSITPIFAPMGITHDNWPATVGLVTGVMAKEVVVGTLNTLYSQEGQTTDQLSEDYHLKQGLLAALNTIPVNLAQLGSALKNPLLASEASVDVNQKIYGVMHRFFDGRVGAFSYLLFVLLYFPCVSTMAAMRREVGPRWAMFSVVWSTGFAYVCATVCYQLLTIMRHPVSSLWISAVMLSALLLAVAVLQRYCRRQVVLPIAAVLKEEV